jgi:glyoxylase-like metal-dependent hydrolase (beta-lactamase superfamily II)
MPALAAGLDYLDLHFQGRPQIIATVILHGPAGVALIDPGPSTTIPTLTKELDKRGIGFGDVRQLVLTHIHLDHAGATGSILDNHPHIDVLVHEKGARHLADPSKLIASAGRIYAQDMDRLWGRILPVPAARIRALAGGETLLVVGRELKVEYTPGHASHHVSYLDTSSRIAFVGDTAGIRRGSGTFVMPPTPPPDIDLAAWRESERKILAWEPDTLFLTHFGPYHGARPHFQAMFLTLAEWSDVVRRLLAEASLTDEDRQQRFVDQAFQDLRRRVGETEAADYTRAGGLNFSYNGLARYWTKTYQSWHSP